MSYYKECPVCDQGFKGRRNRIYCTSACKSQANNERQMEKNYVELEIVNALKTNRRILRDLIGVKNQISLSSDELMNAGYDNDYCTGFTKDSLGQVVPHCFEFEVHKLRGTVHLKRNNSKSIEMLNKDKDLVKMVDVLFDV